MKGKRYSIQLNKWFTTLLVLTCMAAFYFSANVLLDDIVPRLVMTESSACDFWFFGIGSLALGSAAFTMFGGARDLMVVGDSQTAARIMIIVGVMIECLLFVGAIMVWREASQYAAWVRQFNQTSVDVRYWIASVVFLNGVLGNLFAAIFLL